MKQIRETRFRVQGVQTPMQVQIALQSLYDVFADEGLGQATFEVNHAGGPSLLIVKHLAGHKPDRAVIETQLAKAGPFTLIE